jgi:hypothetical protein
LFNSLLKISISVANQAVSSLGNFFFAFFLHDAFKAHAEADAGTLFDAPALL